MAPTTSSVFRFSDVEVHERELHIRRNGDVRPVEPKAFRVLVHLLRNPGRLVPKDELIQAGWGDTAVTDNSLTRNIALLRRLLGDDPREPRYIETVSTVGYRFVCPVEVEENSTEGGEAVGDPNIANGAGFGCPSSKDDPGTQVESSGSMGANRHQATRLGTIQIWLPISAALAIATGAVAWYLLRPLPPPRITERYSRITHDGRSKALGGTDGSRLYFTQFSPPAIAQVSVTGGNIVTIPVAVPNVASVEDVSPDGTTFLIASQEEGNPSRILWTLPILGGSSHRLGDALAGTFSPDGKMVAYSTLSGDISAVGTNGSGVRKLASPGGRAYQVAWSPDGKTIRFTKDGKLWELSSAGSNAHELLPGWGGSTYQCCGKWTPDGAFYLFLSGSLALPNGAPAPAGEQQIWALDERRRLFAKPEAEPVQLTAGPIHWGAPIPSKMGKNVFADGKTERGELVRFDAKNGQFEPFLGGISAECVAFSNDGKSIVYVSFPEGVLWKANSDGSNPVQLTEPPLIAYIPQWSPDGTKIVFINAPARRIYVVSSDGSDLRQLLPDDTGIEDAPSWSPDGRRIVFSTGQSKDRKVDNLKIVDLASRHVNVVAGSVGMFAPRWSPDGKFIAAHAFDSHSLKTYDVEKQHWSEISTHGKMVGLTWSHDSRSLYFLLVTKDDQSVFRIAIDGGQPERIVHLKDLHLTGFQGFSWSLDPINAPLFLRDIGSDDIYSLTLNVN